MEAIPYLADLGPTTLLGVAVLLILLGKLRPERDSREWRRAWEISEAARSEEARQSAELIQRLEANTHLLESIRTTADQERRANRD